MTPSMYLASATAVVAVLGMLALWLRARRTTALLEATIAQLEALRTVVLADGEVAPAEPGTDRQSSTSTRSTVVRLAPDGGIVDAEVIDAELVDTDDQHLPGVHGSGAQGPGTRESSQVELAAEAAARRKLALDLLARHSLVRVAAFSHGVRHAMRPANRNRIRFEMKQEVKRHRRARKDEVKVALREYRARERARIADENATGENGTEGGVT